MRGVGFNNQRVHVHTQILYSWSYFEEVLISIYFLCLPVHSSAASHHAASGVQEAE